MLNISCVVREKQSVTHTVTTDTAHVRSNNWRTTGQL